MTPFRIMPTPGPFRGRSTTSCPTWIRRYGVGLLTRAFVLCLTPLHTAADDTLDFLWEQANTQAAAASSATTYLQAAETYNRLVKAGARNAPLFINLGSVLVMAGDFANAEAALTRAERYGGATPETRQGLLAARALQSGHSRVDLPWSRTAFFWHYTLPCRFRALVALTGWNLLWLGIFGQILIYRYKRIPVLKSLSEAALLTGVLFFAVFAASTLMTLVDERHDDATWNARTFLTPAAQEAEP